MLHTGKGEIMQSDKKLFDDMTRLAGSAFGVMSEARKELEAMLREQVKSFLQRADLVTREEFEVVRDMAAKAREEQEALKKEIAALKGKRKKK